MQHKVKMIQTQRGVRAGEIHPSTFIEGQQYEIDQALLDSFIDLGVVELAGQKAQSHAPANKMKAGAPENKGR